MKKPILLLLAVLLGACATNQTKIEWKPAGDRILTTWGENLDVYNVHQEYPRPILVRKEWKSLNGFWDYAIVAKDETPSEYQGKILVPFPIESALSGVGKTVGEENSLWYSTTFKIPRGWKNQSIILHFGAVDFMAEVYVNDRLVGSHLGGYVAFDIDITTALAKGVNTLKVKVWDPTDNGGQAVGKQTCNPRGIWYTSVTGIWQTVWMEPVANNYIADLRILPDVDNSTLIITPEIVSSQKSENTVTDFENAVKIIKINVLDAGKIVAESETLQGEPIIISIDSPKLWSPDSPFLYDLDITYLVDDKAVDHVTCYAAMRKISKIQDENGIWRMQLNNKTLFQMGTLDQGWWPDGLYTAPSDEALKFDIQKTKDMGFNMIRKHVKVEPQRWYYHCDKLGMLVWQDMPSGQIKGSSWDGQRHFIEEDTGERSQESKDMYAHEWSEIMDMLYSYPCIVVWVPFNESWGQFETMKVAEWTKQHDPSRLLNIASGGNLFRTGDILDIHNYPQPEMYFSDPDYVNVLGEYGGIGCPVAGHLWQADTTAKNKNWGYISLEDKEAVTNKYIEYLGTLEELIKQGFAASIYTQTTDVEIEVNGLMTYDRKIVKMDEAAVAEANKKTQAAGNK